MHSQFELSFVRAEEQLARPWVQEACGWKFAACERILALQFDLLGTYVRAEMVQEQLGIGPPGNAVLRNALGNSISIAASSLALLRQGYYGSARVLARQLFEMMLTAKVAQLDRGLHDKWTQREPGGGARSQVRVTADVLDRHWPRKPGAEPSPLHALWSRLNEFTHHTRLAQQPFLLPPMERIDVETGAFRHDLPPSPEERRTFSELAQNTEFTTDLLFVLLTMGNHLLTPHFRRTTQSFMRTYGGSTGLGPREKRLRDELGEATRAYWDRIDADKRAIRRLWRPIARQYASDWGKARRRTA